MGKVYHINSHFLSYLNPLVDWRIMDIKSLKDSLGHRQSYQNFCRAIRLLENRKVVNSYRDPFTKKKYIYLGEKAHSEFRVDKKSLISNETLIHDLKVTEFTKQFLEMGFVSSVILEHELIEKDKSIKIIPDALMKGSKKGIDFSMAFELELSRKSNERFLDKIESYLVANQYDYVFYILPNESLVQKYYQDLALKFKDRFTEKIMFFGTSELTTSSVHLANLRGKFRNQNLSVKDLFSG